MSGNRQWMHRYGIFPLLLFCIVDNYVFINDYGTNAHYLPTWLLFLNFDLVSPYCLLGEYIQNTTYQTRLYPSEYEGHLGELMVSNEEIRSRVRELAKLIHKDYEGSRPVMLCTLKGACPVSSPQSLSFGNNEK